MLKGNGEGENTKTEPVRMGHVIQSVSRDR